MDREKLAENMQTIVPIMFKRFIKSFPAFEIPKHQIELLFHIKFNDGKPMSYYSEKMMIPKSNLTVMTDKLLDEGLIERELDPNDRRVILLKITKEGESLLGKCRAKVKEQITEKLNMLSDEDVTRLNILFAEMKEILDKIDY